MITRSVQADAADPKQGMTLDELAAFVQACHRAEVAGEARVHVRITWSGGIKRAETR